MNSTTKTDLRKLSAFLRKHKATDFRVADLLNPASLEKFKWPADTSDKQDLLDQLKAYQRLLRLLPAGKGVDSSDYAKELLKEGFHSALQITDMGRLTFVSKVTSLFDGDVSQAESVFKRALACRKLVAIKYLKRRQQLESHSRAAGIHL